MISADSTIPRSRDRGPIEARHIPGRTAGRSRFRDREIAAPLKQPVAWRHAGGLSRFRDREIAAPLKRMMFPRGCGRPSEIPRSRDRGPIEARGGDHDDIGTLPAIPRSRDRGPIEAGWRCSPRCYRFAWIPRSRDRGPIEANPTVRPGLIPRGGFRDREIAAPLKRAFPVCERRRAA